MSDLIQATCQPHSDLQIIAAVGNKQEAVLYRERCDVALVSAALGTDALEMVRTFGRGAGMPAVVVMGLPNTDSVILRYLEAGSAGCIREQDSAEELVRAIRLAAVRQIALAPDLYPAVLRRVSTLAAEQRAACDVTGANDKSLTRREREILQLIAQGYANRDIAQHLTIELGTTKNHVHNILDKLNVRTRQDAALYLNLGLI
jgi:DNA-binding NarL/FixJ family response regulator